MGKSKAQKAKAKQAEAVGLQRVTFPKIEEVKEKLDEDFRQIMARWKKNPPDPSTLIPKKKPTPDSDDEGAKKSGE